MRNIHDYALRMERALKRNKPFSDYNEDLRHASVVVCESFRHAKGKIRLLSEKLDDRLYGSEWFLDEAKGFLDRDGELCVLVETDLAPTHPVSDLVSEHKNVTIKRVPDRERETYSYNFMVVDDKGYRFERDRSEPKAIVRFNDEDPHPGLVKILTARFEELWDKSDGASPQL